MLFITKRSDRRAKVRFLPGLLLFSLLASLLLTVVLNVLVRLF